ncbi:response regulator transcription factor [Conexibacter sp. DBS9H8]|uniref:response regulator transcription factor n=1 Tax=Conexibacter sp. DBS9H8 TaxID=2937801 RepID=UPI00200F98FC|nr:response regulator transcription factor [Conexibacter sp. DBS9H8]
MSLRAPVTVVLSQFEDIIGLGLRVLIDGDPGLELVAHNVPHSELAAVLLRHAPRVAVLNFGSLVSATDLRALRRSCPDTRLLVLANHPGPNECRQLLSFGADACLAKHTEARDVLHAIHLASRGLQVLPAMDGGGEERAPAPGPDLLTPREADVLTLLQRGRSNAEIALELSVGIETVRTHARRVYRKLGVRTRRELRSASGRT